MGKRVLMNVVGVVVGVPLGMILMMGLHFLSGLVYPAPEGVDMMSSEPDQVEAVKAWMATLPAGAFLLAALAHGLGCMGGAAIATLIAGRRSMVAAIVVGVLFTFAGIMNLMMMPHPSWFPFLDMPIYLVLALVAGKLLRRAPATE